MPTPISAVYLEFPGSKTKSNIEVTIGTPQNHRRCHCKQSRCLKLYCECFASATYCDGCSCANCHNNAKHEVARQEAVENTLDRNPNAFQPKIVVSPYKSQETADEEKDSLVGKHNKGCHCKKTGCQKRYCECFRASIFCSGNCQCMGCKNSEGRVRRKKDQDLDITPNEPPMKKLEISEHVVDSGRLGSSKFIYRSLLADMIDMQDVRDLCSALVAVSKAATTVAGGKTEASESRAMSTLASKAKDNFQAGADFQAALSEMAKDGFQLGHTEAQEEVTPETVALNENILVMDSASSNQIPKYSFHSDIYNKQERMVLVNFLCCLTKLISSGNMKGMAHIISEVVNEPGPKELVAEAET